MNDVLILREPDKMAEAQARKRRWSVVVEPGSLADVAFDRALIAAPRVGIPWPLVEYGMGYLERWDAAAPLWRYNVLAADVGTAAERTRTQKVVGDMRVLLYVHELLFVRGNDAGRGLLAAFEQEQYAGGEPRLAFLRALFAVKPIFCALPTTWWAPSQNGEGLMVTPPLEAVPPARPRRSRPKAPLPAGMVRVEIRPGVYSRCKAGEEEAVLKRYGKLHLTRGERKE